MRRSVEEYLAAQEQALNARVPALKFHFVSIEHKGQVLRFLPIGTFRQFHVFQHEIPHKTFLSSGSTNSSRAQHSFSENGLANYKRASTSNFTSFLKSLQISLDAPIVSLIPNTSEWPQSSLAAMIEMFSDSGLNVQYFPEIQKTLASDVVIFGTSFHHVLAQQDPLLKSLQDDVKEKRVTVIDTGGTKGRTRNYALSEVHEIIHATYASAKECRVVSEYGMCELASQAWSLNAPHDGWFKTADSLTPIIVDLDKRASVENPNQIGFLAFIDEGNIDSYGAIITEDLAQISPDDPNCFKLIGRAPDASLKGCSLNVKANFQATTPPEESLSCQRRLASRAQRSGMADGCAQQGRVALDSGLRRNDNFALKSIIDSLPSDIWDTYAKQDLLQSLKSIQTLNLPLTRDGQRVAMVLSANIPITFLYPAFVCLFRGVKELHLYLPSLRPDDEYAKRVREQIQELAQAIAPFLHPMTLSLHSNKDVMFSELGNFDAVVAFGSDETIQTFRDVLQNTQTELIGLGSVANAVRVGSRTPAQLAELCSQWMGRGCLTPVALVGDPDAKFVRDFSNAFDFEFSQRMNAAHTNNRFAHRHKFIEIEAYLNTLGLAPERHVFRGKQRTTFVIDLREAPVEFISQNHIPIRDAGSGLVFLITEEQLAKLDLNTYTPEPQFLEPHMGKNWAEWI